MARELLTVTVLEIGDIAEALSYSAHSSFVDALGRWSGVMPSDWRRALDPFWAWRKAIPHAIALAAASVLFELITARYERRSMLITANQPFGEWGKSSPIRP